MILYTIKEIESSGGFIPATVKHTFIEREKTIDSMNLSNTANHNAKKANVDMFLIQIDMFNKYGHMVF